MIVRRKGGLTEFIPSPQEKREGFIRDYVLDLLENVHFRLERLEHEAGLPAKEAEVLTELFEHLKTDETRSLQLYTSFITGGSFDP